MHLILRVTSIIALLATCVACKRTHPDDKNSTSLATPANDHDKGFRFFADPVLNKITRAYLANIELPKTRGNRNEIIYQAGDAIEDDDNDNASENEVASQNKLGNSEKKRRRRKRRVKRIYEAPIRFGSIEGYSSFVDKLGEPFGEILRMMESLFRGVERNLNQIVCYSKVPGKGEKFERPVCEACPTRDKRLDCGVQCDQLSIECSRRQCDPCPYPDWCPEILPGQKCPPEPVCPADLCSRIYGASEEAYIEEKAAEEWYLIKLRGATQGDADVESGIEAGDRGSFFLKIWNEIKKKFEWRRKTTWRPWESTTKEPDDDDDEGVRGKRRTTERPTKKGCGEGDNDDDDDDRDSCTTRKPYKTCKGSKYESDDDDDDSVTDSRDPIRTKPGLVDRNVNRRKRQPQPQPKPQPQPQPQLGNLIPKDENEAKAMLKLQLEAAGFGHLTKVPLNVLRLAFKGKMAELQAILSLLNKGAHAASGLTDILRELMNPTGTLEVEATLQVDLDEIFGGIFSQVLDQACRFDLLGLLPQCRQTQQQAGDVNVKGSESANNSLRQSGLAKNVTTADTQFIGDNGRIFTSLTVQQMVWSLIQHILLDLIRRQCKCNKVCPPIMPTKCKCPPNDCLDKPDIFDNKTLIIKCRACPMPNVCPVPRGCRRNAACPDCADFDLTRHYNETMKNRKLEDLDPENPVGISDFARENQRVNLYQACDKLRNSKACQQFATCGAAPLNPLSPRKQKKENATSSRPTRATRATLKPNPRRGYIRKGQDALPGSWPSFARLQILKYGNTHVCGGVLIARHLVLTAGHCASKDQDLLDKSAVRVIMGEYNRFEQDSSEQEFEVESICRAKKYQDGGLNGSRYDFAVLQLKKGVEFNDYVQTACLPSNITLFEKRGSIKTGSQCFVMGMGVTGTYFDNSTGVARNMASFSEKMQMMGVKRVSCNSWGISNADRSRHCFTKAQGQGDTCGGDSGGPILCLDSRGRWTVMGLVSYGLENCDGRGPVGWVGVYTRLPALINTILDDCEIFKKVQE